jgi:CheY-like chemotaxis protein
VALHGDFQRALDDLHEQIAESRRLLHSAHRTLGQSYRSERQYRRVLVVEENVDAAMSVQHELRHLGHTVECAHTPASALVLSKYFLPDVALFDIAFQACDEHLERRLRGQQCERMHIAHFSTPIDMRELARAVANG